MTGKAAVEAFKKNFCTGELKAKAVEQLSNFYKLVSQRLWSPVTPQSAASPGHPRLRARRRRAPTPFERAASECMAVKLRHMELEEALDYNTSATCELWRLSTNRTKFLGH